MMSALPPKATSHSATDMSALCKSGLVRRSNFIIYFAPSTTSGGFDADTPLSARVFRPFPEQFHRDNVAVEFLRLAAKDASHSSNNGSAMMAMMTRRMTGASAIAFLFTASMVAAQAPASVRVRATITSVDGGTLTAKARDGGEMKIKLADNAPVNEVVKAPLSDIKEGSYLAITASPQPDGSQKAMAILIFPPG